MSTYLVHSIYHRQLALPELETALEHGNGLLLVDAEGQPKYVENPLGMARRPKDELRQLWRTACEEGRVFLVWATRWNAAEELPAQAAEPVNEPTHA